MSILLLALLSGCQSSSYYPSQEDAADAIFRADAAIVRRHGRTMSWEKQQIDGYSAVLQERPLADLSCKERELRLIQPSVDALIAHAESSQRKFYDDMARHQMLLILKGGNPCGFPVVNLSQ